MSDVIKSHDNVVVAHNDYDTAISESACGTAVAYGRCGFAIAEGDHGLAVAHGKYSTAMARGKHGHVKGSQTGCNLVIRATGNYVTAIVGENGIKPDTWYGLKDGQFTKV